MSNSRGVKIADVARKLGIGRNTLFKELRQKRVLNDMNLPRDRFINRGYFTVRHNRYEDHSKKEFRDNYVTLVTPEGILFIHRTITMKAQQESQSNA